MKTSRSVQFGVFVSSLIVASQCTGAQQKPTVPAPPTVQKAHETAAELQQLVAPIALYPDALVADVLAAAGYPALVQTWQQPLTVSPGIRAQKR